VIAVITAYWLFDPRVVNKPYGATFIKSLPAIPRTRSWRPWENFSDHGSESAAPGLIAPGHA
jgi:hypothetical protein